MKKNTKAAIGVVISILICMVIGWVGRGVLHPFKVPPGPKPTAISSNGSVVVFTVQVQGDGSDSHQFNATINFFSSRILIWKDNVFMGDSVISAGDIRRLNNELVASNAGGGTSRLLDITSSVNAATLAAGNYEVETVLWWNDGTDQIVTEWLKVTIPQK